MRGDVLAENVVISYAQSCGLVFVPEILGRVTDDAACVKIIVRADRRQPREIDVRSDGALRSYFYALADDRIGPDFDACIQLRSRMNNSSGVDHGAASSHAAAVLSSQRRCLQSHLSRVLALASRAPAVTARVATGRRSTEPMPQPC